MIRNNKNHIEEIRSLEPLITSINGKEVIVHFNVINSMHDNKEVVILAKDVLRYTFYFFIT